MCRENGDISARYRLSLPASETRADLEKNPDLLGGGGSLPESSFAPPATNH